MTTNNPNLYAHFQAVFRAGAKRIALQTAEGADYTFSDLDEGSGRMAGYLRSLGLLPGERVSVQVE